MTDSSFSLVSALVALVILPTVAKGDPVLSLESGVTVVQGETASVRLSISGGKEPYAGVNVRLTLPEGISMESATAGPLLSANFVLESRGYIEAEVNKSAIVIYSDSDTLDTSEGVLVTLSLRASETAPVGTFPIAFDEGASGISNEDGTVSVLHTTTDGSITVRERAGEGGRIVICAPGHSSFPSATLPDGALLLFVACALILKNRHRVPLHR